MTKNRYKGGRRAPAALNAYVKLVRAAESVSALVHGHLAGAALTVSQFGVLEALYHLGPLSQAELAKKILKSTGNITMVIDNLEKRGLVRRERSREDRRYYAVHLTAEGKKTIGRIFPDHAVKITRVMNILTAEELKTLGKLCRKLGLQEKG
jgi:MarR family 2-MHQ and catechol resistance regulon transcriptional repressor